MIYMIFCQSLSISNFRGGNNSYLRAGGMRKRRRRVGGIRHLLCWPLYSWRA